MFAPVPPRPDADESTDPPVAVPADLVDDLRAVVGPNADYYYLRAWRPVLTGQPGGTGFNRAAFFLGGFWLAYRRMYLWAFAYYSLVLAEGVVEDVVFAGLLGMAQAPAPLRFVVVFAAAVVCGGLGNRWYLAHARTVAADARSVTPPGADPRRAMAARGGTDFPGAVLVLTVAVLAGAGLGFMLGLVFGPP